MKCWTCINSHEIPGDCHLRCSNPPENQERIGAGGKERYDIAEKLATRNNSVVRCVWGGSGWFPFCFDGNTVFGCSTFKEAVKKGVDMTKQEVAK